MIKNKFVKAKLNPCVRIFSTLFLAALAINSQAQVLFEEKTPTDGTFHTGESWGASWGDMNGDLYPDIYVSNHNLRNGLLRNNGDGTFSNIVLQADLDQIWTIDPVADIHGGTWADFDNDGDQDLFATRSSDGARHHLFINNGQGLFTEESSAYGAGGIGGGRLPILFDYDKDGLLDVAVARNGGSVPLYRQQGGGFVNVSGTTGFLAKCYRNAYGFTSQLFDDGALIYGCMNLEGIPEKVFDTSTVPFTEVPSKFDHIGTYSDTAIADFDNDLKQDLIAVRGRTRPNGVELIDSTRIESWLSISSHQEKSFTFKATGNISIDLYSRKVATKNKDTGSANFDQYDKVFIGGTGTFPADLPFTLSPTNQNHWGIADRTKLGAYVGYDEITQEWTIYLSSGNGDTDLVYFTVDGVGLTAPSFNGIASVDQPLPPVVLMNNGSKLIDSGSKGIGSLMCGSVVADDFDNDMDVDLYMVCRTSLENMANRFFWNDGTGNFTAGPVHGAEGFIGAGLLSGAGTGEIAVSADYDIDGFVDVFVTNGLRLFPSLKKDGFTAGGMDQLFRNQGNANHWLEFDVQGINSNRDGFGTKITVTAGGVSQFREQNGRYHRWSHDHRRIHFGLGTNTTATVTVEWPDGTTDVHNNVAADKLFLAAQDGTLTELTPGTAAQLPSPQTGDECGTQAYDTSIDTGIFITKDCTTGIWELRAMAGGSASNIQFTGMIQSSQGLSNVSTVSFEGTDFINTSNPNLVDFSLTMAGTGIDGFDFETAGDTCLIIDTPVETKIFLGDGHHLLSSPTSLTSLGSACLSNLSIDDVTVSEGDGTASLTVSLSEVSTSVVSVDYTTVDGSATAGSDYVAASGTLTLNPGETSAAIVVTLIDDADVELVDETLTLALSNSVNALIQDDSGSITLQDNEVTACGEPTYDTATDREMFLWQDCLGDGSWHIRTTAGGGSALSYEGNITSNQNFSNVTPFSYEGSDALDVSNPQLMLFTMGMAGTGQDGIDFEVSPGNTCLSLAVPTGIDVLVGEDRLAVTPPFDIETLGACQSGLSIDDVTVSEADGTASLTVSLSEASTSVVNVDYTTVDGSATAGSDYVAASGTLTLNPGETSAAIVVTLIDDADVELVDETLTLALSNSVNALIQDDSGSITLQDNEVTACGEPTYDTATDREMFLWQDCLGDGSWHIRTTAGGGSALSYEGNITSNQNFSNVTPFSYEGSDALDVSNPQLMLFTMGMTGTGQDGIDFEVSPGNTCLSMAVPAGINVLVGEARLAVTPPFDIETLGACQSGLSIDDVTVSEADGTASLTVSLSEASTSVVNVDYTTVDGSATAGSDYVAASGTLTLNPGETSAAIVVTLIDDSDAEPVEQFNLQLSNPVNALMSDNLGMVTINDDEVSACGDPGYDRTTERAMFLWQDCAGDGTWYVRATAGGGSNIIYSGEFASDQTFSNVVNYSIESSDTVDISDPQSIDFVLKMGSVWDDGFNFQVSSGSTCLTLDLPTGTDVLVGKDRLAVTTPFDIDTLGACQSGLSIDDVTVSEADGTASLTVSLSEVSTSVVSVDYTTVDGSATAGSDYVAASGTLTLNPGETSAAIVVTLIDDADVELVDETLTLALSNSVNALIQDDSGSITLQDNEVTACGEPTYDTATDREMFLWQDCLGDGSWHIRTTAGGGSALSYEGNITSNQNFSNVTPFSYEGSDVLDVSNPQLMLFTMGMTGTGQDGIDFEVSPGNTCLSMDVPAGIDVLVGEARLAVTPPFDIETLGACQSGLSIDDVTVSEADGTASLTVSLSEASPSVVSVDYTTVDGSATAGSDYVAASGTLTLNPGETSAAIVVTLIDDSDAEPVEQFNLQLSNPVNALMSDNSGIVTINDDEVSACGDPGYDRTTERAMFLWQDCAGDGTWYVRATAGGGSNIIYSGEFASDQTFSNVVNYSIESSDTVDISDPQSIDFVLKMGSVWDDGFNFQVGSGSTCLTLDLPTGTDVLVGKDRLAVTTPFDIDTLGACQSGLSIDDVTVSEADGTASLTVSLSEASTSVVSVDYTTVDGSATAGSDYVAASGTLTLNPGETSAAIVVTLIDDSVIEIDKLFSIALTNPSAALINDETGSVTIKDDDASACGEPVYDSSIDRELFLWQDCAGDGTWYLRATAGGGSTINYDGDLSSDQTFSNIAEVSIESTDTVDTSDPSAIDFLMKVGSVLAGWY